MRVVSSVAPSCMYIHIPVARFAGTCSGRINCTCKHKPLSLMGSVEYGSMMQVEAQMCQWLKHPRVVLWWVPTLWPIRLLFVCRHCATTVCLCSVCGESLLHRNTMIATAVILTCLFVAGAADKKSGPKVTDMVRGLISPFSVSPKDGS